MDAYLDEIVQQTKAQHDEAKVLDNSVLKMERAFFNHKKELKQLFAKVMGGKNVVIPTEDKKEEAKADLLEGYSKKMKRMILLQEKMKQKNRVITVSKKQILCTPDSKWPRVDAGFLSMKMISEDPKTRCRYFSFVKSPEYQSLQKEFNEVQATCDIQALADFLRQNWYHHESLIFIADYLRL